MNSLEYKLFSTAIIREIINIGISELPNTKNTQLKHLDLSLLLNCTNYIQKANRFLKTG